MSIASHDFWSFIDGSLVINLDIRPDRWADFQVQISTLELPAPLIRMSAVRGIDLAGFGQRPWFRNGKRSRNWAGRAGCALSHRRAIEHAKNAGWRTVLILEDDAILQNHFSEVTSSLKKILDNQRLDWSVCYLGFTQPEGPSRQLADLGFGHSLHQVYGCYTTHAYLLRDTTYDWLLKQLPDERSVWSWIARHRAIDRWFSRNLAKRFVVLALAPSIVGQQISVSDITGRTANGDDVTAFYSKLPNRTSSDSAYRHASAVYALGLSLRSLGDWFRALAKRIFGF